MLLFHGEELLAPTQSRSKKTTPCRLSATAYSTHSQELFIPGGRLLHPQPETAPHRDEKEPTYHTKYDIPFEMEGLVDPLITRSN
jgi:hypothetical protein